MNATILKLVLTLQLGLPAVLCQDAGSSDVSKAFITLGILFGALVISLVVAKILDFCYDRSTLRDDASDISEHTRKLIRARLAVMTFPKRGEPTKPATKAQRVSRVIRIWSAKSKRNSQISAQILAELGGVGAKGDKQPLKVAFIDIPDTIPQHDSTRRPSASTLQVPLEPDVMVIESADDLSDNASQNIPEVVLKVPVLPSRSPTPTSALKQEPKNPTESQMNGASDKSAGSSANTDPKLLSTTKSVPKNESKSSTAVPTPSYVPSPIKPLNKSKSVPFMSTRTNSPTKEKPQNAFRSPSPPKILVKKPTESELVPTVTRNASTKINVKTISEKNINQSNIVTTQPKPTRAMSAKSDSSSPRLATEKKRVQPTARSAPSKIVSTSNDKNGGQGTKVVQFKAESKKSVPPNNNLKKSM